MTRGDRNKSGSSGRGTKASQTRQRATSWPSEIEKRSTDVDVSIDGNSNRLEERRFDLIVDSVPYMVRAVPFTFNGEIRFRVSFNESSEHVFTWDSSLGQLRAIDDDASTMPDNLEIAISEKLQSRS